MTRDEFNKAYAALLDTDSPKSGYSMTQRTFTDSESLRFCDHLWELFSAHASVELSADRLCRALLKTHNKFDSEQDRAAAIVAFLNQPTTGGAK